MSKFSCILYLILRIGLWAKDSILDDSQCSYILYRVITALDPAGP